MEILTYTGEELTNLLNYLRGVVKDQEEVGGLYIFRIDVREDGLAIKENEYGWTPTIKATRKGS